MDDKKLIDHFYSLSPSLRLRIVTDLCPLDDEMCTRIPFAFYSDAIEAARRLGNLDEVYNAIEQAYYAFVSKTPKDVPKKYPYSFVLESQHGCYPLSSWCFVGAYPSSDEAISACKKWGDGYRVVDGSGVIVYPIEQERTA